MRGRGQGGSRGGPSAGGYPRCGRRLTRVFATHLRGSGRACFAGGEKETGGGREAGSDSWKQYMRRATWYVCTHAVGHRSARGMLMVVQPRGYARTAAVRTRPARSTMARNCHSRRASRSNERRIPPRSFAAALVHQQTKRRSPWRRYQSKCMDSVHVRRDVVGLFEERRGYVSAIGSDFVRARKRRMIAF